MNGTLDTSQDNFDRLSQLLSQMPFIIIFSDLKNENDQQRRKITYISETIQQFGYKTEEFLTGAIKFRDLVHLDDRSQIYKELENSIIQQRPYYHSEYRLQAKNGIFHWVHDITAMHYDSSGKVVRFEEFLNDISSRKELESALHQSDLLFRDLIGTMNEAFAIEAKNGILSYVNEKFCSMLGYQPKDLLLHSPREFLLPTSIDLYDEENSERQHGTLVSRYELAFLSKSGDIHYCLVSSRAIYNKQNEYNGNFAIITDITDRKTMEQELRDSEMKYRTLFENASDGLLILDPYAFIDANVKIEELFHCSHNQILNLHPWDVSPPTQADGSLSSTKAAAYINAALDGTPQIFEWIHQKFDSTLFDAQISLNRFIVRKKQLILASVRDISIQKKMEAEFLKSQKIESIGILAGGIAHDFNNFLGAILGNLSLLKLEAQSFPRQSDIRTFLEEIERATIRAKDLTNQLLTFAKGGIPVKSPTNITNVIQETAIFALRGSKSSVEFKFSADLHPVDIDSGQISQVINNIVLNADQAMPRGGNIVISAENVSLDDLPKILDPFKNYIRISVRDEGVGIPPEFIIKIFDPYFTTKPKGSGLGLSICYSIVKKHDGAILVESKVGKGSTFHIYLPTTGQFVVESLLHSQPLIQGKGRILIMDDDEAMRQVFGSMLTHLGYTPVFSRDGTECIQKFKEARITQDYFHAVIMDLTIQGGMGGKETILELRQLDKSVFAIVCSGYSTDAVLANYQAYQFNGYLFKPFTIEDLSASLDKNTNFLISTKDPNNS